MQATVTNPSNASLDPLWPDLQARAAAGLLSSAALVHLLALADTLSADGDWPRAWQTLAIAATAADRVGNPGYQAEAAIHRGILDYRQGNLQLAITAWEDALAQFTALAQVEGCANCHANLGAAYKSLGEMPVAQEHLAEALARYREMGYLAGQATALTNLGLVHKDIGAIVESRDCFIEALAIFAQLGDVASQAACLGNLGIMALPSDIRRSLAYQEQARALFRQSGDMTGEANTEGNLGIIYQTLGEPDRAAAHFKRALELDRALGRRAGVAEDLVNLGLLYRDAGDLSAARAALEEAYAVHSADGRADGALIALGNLAMVYRALGNPRWARARLEEALTLAQHTGQRRNEAHVWANLGLLHQEQGEFARAEACHRTSLALKRELDDKLGEEATLGNLGTLARVQGRYDDAVAFHQQALALSRAIEHRAGEAENLANLALASRDRGDLPAALACQDAALALVETLNQPELVWRVYAGRAETYRRLGQPARAAADLRTAVTSIEAVRGGLNRDEEKLTFFGEDKGTIYTRLITLLHRELRRDDEALAYVERARSRVFLELLARRQMRAAHTEAPLTFSEIVAMLRRAGQPGVSRVRERVMAEPHVVLAEYFTTEDLTLLFIVRADFDEPKVVEIPGSLDALRQYVQANFGAGSAGPGVRDLDPDDWQARLAPFVAPLLPWVAEGDILWLAPHDVLHYLPLHALRVDGRTLAERNPICYTPSASVMPYCHAKRKPVRGGGALVLGDSRTDRPLPFAREEARRVAQLLGGAPRLGSAATRATVVEALADEAGRQAIDVLHIACHGYFDAAEALKSGLVLAPDDQGDTLTAEQIFGLQMRAELVTLSACESGVNERRPGDELIGLTRALIYAGTPSVLVSLWRVDDLATALLMEQFYREWRGGMGKAQALQAAQCWLMRLARDEALTLVKMARDDALARHRQAGGEDTRARQWWAALAARYIEIAEAFRPGKRPFAHPYYWAPFVLVGDWQ